MSSQMFNDVPGSGIDNHEDRALKEEIYLQSLLPCEIWMLILDIVGKTPEDLEMVINSSPYFRKLLAPKRVLFLFPKVWSILGEKYRLCRKINGPYDDTRIYDPKDLSLIEKIRLTQHPMFPMDMEIFQFLFQKRVERHHPILKLRQICHTWNKTIDQVYQQDKEHFSFEIDILLYDGSWSSESINADSETPEKFMSHFDATHSGTLRSPFISRSIIVRFEEESDWRGQMLETWNDFLTKYGKHIWYILIDITTGELTSQETSRLFIRWLTQLPNLKVLRIAIGSVLNSDAAEVEEALNHNTFPKLESLEVLETRFVPEVIIKPLLCRNRHVSKVKIHNLHGQVQGIPAKFPNLKDLNLPSIGSKDDFEFLEQVDWKLENLDLDLCEFYKKHSKSKIFNLLEMKWADTLTGLTLIFPEAAECFKSLKRENKILEECSSIRLNLTKLTSLVLTLRTIFSLDFILPMKNTLEYLNVRVCFPDHTSPRLTRKMEETQEIQFLGYFDRLLESNIWNLFPKLHQVDVSHKNMSFCYTRDDWLKASACIL